MGNSAPDGYLKCDGTVYNIEDYPILAGHFETEFGTKNNFGGDGETTFAVPDLQGEFLRCTGTNSNRNQGSGANVGVHQDGTVHPAISSSYPSYNQAELSHYDYSWNNQGTSQPNMDSTLTRKTSVLLLKGTAHTAGPPDHRDYMSRPTNTSVWYCIKY